jgi:hypothetical protein
LPAAAERAKLAAAPATGTRHMNRERLIPLGFVIGGLVNILGVPLFSLGFHNPDLDRLVPGVFPNFGLLTIMLWGAAYIATARHYASVRWLVLVFALEKLAYGITWLLWMSHYAGELPKLLAEAPLTGAFMAIYGPNDLAFALFFAWVFLSTRPKAT